MYKLWNNAKTTILLAALMGLCLGIGYLIGGRGALLPAFLIGGAMNLLAFFFSDKIALATVGAQRISREDDPALWDTVEELAGRAGAELAGSPRGLADALWKLESASRRIPLPVPETQSNLFIVAPLTGRSVAKLFMTHPPVQERIERLMAMER